VQFLLLLPGQLGFAGELGFEVELSLTSFIELGFFGAQKRWNWEATAAMISDWECVFDCDLVFWMRWRKDDF
jgi:hypothetical protein